MKRKKEAEYDVQKCLKAGKYAEAVDVYNDLGNKLREAGQLDEAIEYIEKGIEIAHEHRARIEETFCLRSLAEIYSIQGNRNECLKNVQLFKDLSKKCDDKSQIQLSWHVEAWCYQRLFDFGSATTSDLETAVKAVRTSRQILEDNKKVIEKKATFGNYSQRKAGSMILEAQLQQLMGRNDVALRLLDTAKQETRDKKILYEILLTKCGLIRPEHRLKYAQELVREACEEKKGNALMEHSHQLVLVGRANEGFKVLSQAIFKHVKNISTDDIEDIKRRMSILYRLVEYLKYLKSKQEKKMKTCEIYEAIADLYYKYYDTLTETEKSDCQMFMKENIVKNYQKMMENTTNEKEQLRGLMGLALVHLDMNEFNESKQYSEKRLKLLKQNGEFGNKIIDSEISIFSCLCKLNESYLDVKFEELKKIVKHPNSKKELFDVWASYCEKRGDEENSNKYKQLADNIQEIYEKNSDDESDLLFSKFTDIDIMEKCKKNFDYEKRNEEDMLNKDKVNANGETKLHVAAKTNNSAEVERLCQLNYDVNRKDNGGWTPLSEAVSYGFYENVRVLIEYNANINCTSSSSLINDSDDDDTAKSGHFLLTPLMEACITGNVQIAMLLIEKGADIGMEDSEGWTCYDHFCNFMEEKGYDDEQKNFHEYLKDLMMKNGVSVAPRRTNRIRRMNTTTRIVDEPVENECVYSNRKRRRSQEGNTNSVKRRTERRSEERMRKSTTPVRSDHSFSNYPDIQQYCEQLSNRSSRAPSIHNSPVSRTPDIIIDDVIFDRPVDRSFITDRFTSDYPIDMPISPAYSTHSSSSRRSQDDSIAVDCYFITTNNPPTPVSLPLPRSMTIGELKERILTKETIKYLNGKKFDSVEVRRRSDHVILDDNLTVSSLPIDTSLEFLLAQLTPYQKYFNSKDKDDTIAEMLRLFQTRKQFDFTRLLLEPTVFKHLLQIISNSEIPMGIQLNLSFCNINKEIEEYLEYFLINSSHLFLRATRSSESFRSLFGTDDKTQLKHLETSVLRFDEQSEISQILSKCPNLETLIMIDTAVPSIYSSPIPDALKSLPHLKHLNLSGTKYLTDEDWKTILASLETLESLTLNSIETDFVFETSWLPNLKSFTARHSILEWFSLFDCLATSFLHKIDVKYSDVPQSLIECIDNGNMVIEK